MEKVIELKNIIKTYNVGKSNELEILHGINIDIYKGEFVAIVGESGSGKTTLMNIIGVLDKATKGSYILANQDISTLTRDAMSEIRNKKIGFVFQSFNLISKTSALKNVELPLLYSKVSSLKRTKIAKELLESVGMADRMSHDPSELSGGQKQRVAIARALSNSPEIILADEPTGALDSNTSKQVMELFTKLNNQGKTIILITHSNEVAKSCPRVISLKDGLITNDTGVCV